MKEEFNFYTVTVSEEQADQRLDHFLGQSDWVKNRSQALHLIKKQFVTLNNQVLKSSYRLKAGDKIEIRILKKQEQEIPPYDFPVEIVHEDESLLVVNKPAGLVVHPAPGHEKDTLINALSHKTLSPGSSLLRPGVVHRLDKETSGLLVLAKNKKIEESLIQQFKERKVKRIYKAVSFSSPKTLTGTIESYIARHPVHRQKFTSLKQAQASAKQAITHYSVLQTHPEGFSYIECRLDTGRTHQIRVHLSSLSCPLVGDKVYGKPQLKNIKSQDILKAVKSLNRVALHAQTIGFIHPETKKEIFFEKSWPSDMRALLKVLQFLE